jgi:hypothetical protein
VSSESDYDDRTGQVALPEVIELNDGSCVKVQDATPGQLIDFARVLAIRAYLLSALGWPLLSAAGALPPSTAAANDYLTRPVTGGV